MANLSTDISMRKAAGIAGYGLLLMTFFALLSDALILPRLIVPGDAAATAGNIMADQVLFRLAICSFIVVAVLDVLVAWAFYILLRSVNRSISLLAAWFRLVYAAILIFSIVFLVIALQILNDAQYLAISGTDHSQAMMMLFINAFSEAWAVGLILFGLHLVLLGYLVLRSGYIPGALGLLVMLAGLSYLSDHFIGYLVPDQNIALSTIFGWGELVFMIWLLVKGHSIPEITE
ncbi:DUF4386 domain-containing protein [Methanolobus profundi]|uniref:DUF4386 domain-containing protein n=1 Tax=Methanolobus profundi TaxID=487685 RepID=A0A1I4PN52_9EURY|nr:DUF4386 domain-containing protein [Methanolobus profundi]SFM29179.1 protein of unknown function [Methanolobus profundi]